jgi:hypothetical protein
MRHERNEWKLNAEAVAPAGPYRVEREGADVWLKTADDPTHDIRIGSVDRLCPQCYAMAALLAAAPALLAACEVGDGERSGPDLLRLVADMIDGEWGPFQNDPHELPGVLRAKADVMDAAVQRTRGGA